ncbi:uncharacterized protein LOC114750825 [Neltuma alba]|uniref:uncharacterized protein LOC114750825 n=1 Tax=Neltuma alba TaxID=207710 RepID=UPI0010A2DF9B|nr:uncharacterized protein LOC114750825 [Prosopis alba]XP_028795279.1 uncharacterized protein LOC114750825 [Prosopis alba]XP_028795281.1 uncharacterized protein LOC114750825 [Prosopis alba]
MGGLLRIFEFNHGSMAKKVHARKRRHGGLEPPRNSLELQVDASQIQCPQGELPYHYQVEELSVNASCSDTVSVKKLINDELCQRPTTKPNAPSLVARLMGIDMMPSDAKSAIPSDEIKRENMGKKFSEKEVNGRGSGGRGSGNSNSCSQMEFDSHCQDTDDDDGWNQYLGKPKPRDHPQEEELQKFKKEFEAFQAARLMECSKAVEVDNNPRQLPARESMDKKKMADHATSHRLATELTNYGGPEYHGNIMELFPTRHKETFPSRSRTLSRDFEESLMMKSNGPQDGYSPTRIVILKPGPDRIYSHEDNWINPFGISQERNSIEDFLKEVRERLKCELQGKTSKKGYVVRGSGIETPYNEKPSDPKQIARNIAKQVRESVTRDVATNLLRSESTKSCRSEIQFNGSSSPEFINRDSRRFLSERLRNVLKSKAYLDIPGATCGNSRSYLLDDHNDRLKQDNDSTNSNYSSHWEISKEEKEMQTGSFRCEQVGDISLPKESSPRNLVRSLSAPVSGTSFGKLLLEDRHILTGAQIRRKLEAIETASVDVKKKKKDRFNIKEKVSNFKYNLVLRGKLFGKKFQSVGESHSNEDGSMMVDVTSGPTVLLNCGERHENSTEVPPSPASVCSNAQEELWKRAEYLSPISTPDVSSRDDNAMPEVLREISSGLNELRRQINQLESDGPEELMVKQEPEESKLAQLEDPAESYIRDLLVASGLYFGSWDKSLLKGDTFAKPIGNSVFEEVEESHKKMLKENETSTKDQSDNTLEHKLLHDLLNEGLFIVLGPPLTLSRFRRKLCCSSSMLPPPRGKELLKLVWEIIRVTLYPPSDVTSDSLDTLVARDLGPNPWIGLMDDELNILEGEIERLVTEDLVEELTRDMIC